jgi:23S rRNA (cytosine1962-C5)-methyltransferase
MNASLSEGLRAALFPAFRAERLLFEDADLVVVDKPAGVPTHAPDAGRVDDAVSRLEAFLGARDGAKPYLGIHQRLDRDTSGVLLFTRRKEANPGVAREFEGRKVKKTYVACVARAPGRGKEGVLEHAIAKGEGGAVRVLPKGDRRGQAAVTRWKVLEAAPKGDRVLLEVVPETGRTHQIRAQLAFVGAPIVGDPLYGGAPARRLLLHATALGLAHPSTGKPVRFRAPVPAAFEEWLRGVDPKGALGDAGRVEALLREAADARYGVAMLPETTCFRIANGGGDGLPGVAVDVYGDHLVVSLSSPEAEAAREAILDAAARLGAAGVYLKVRPKDSSRVVDTRREELAPRDAVRGTSAPEAFTVHELGLPFEVRLGDGLSTGVFLDQRENRRRVREASKGLRVLNLFAYTGPFTVAAVLGGARASSTVDVSRGVLAWARRNLDAVGADAAAHETVEADAIGWLDAAAKRGERYDLAVLDPPSFATTKSSRFSAESDYRPLAARVLRVLGPGGRLVACTNHRGIARLKLRRLLHEAAREAGREVAQMKDLPDPVDFPAEPGAECHLKSVLVTLAR